MNLVLIGLSHKTATVEVRETVSFPEKQLDNALLRLKAEDGIRECLILSTCNRMEVLVRTSDAEEAVGRVKGFISRYHNIGVDKVTPYLYAHTNEKAIHHLFTVACSLDSMVVGEPQILGQLKDAYQHALEQDCTGLLLNNLLPRAFNVAKRVRTETEIAQNAVSISYAAVELAKKIFADLSDKTVMIVGAGEMSELVAQHLVGNGVKNVFVANRTYERAVDLAQRFSGTAVRYEQMLDEMSKADIVISSTGAPHIVIHHADVQKVIHQRKNRPMFFIDIAVPRDIDPEVNKIDNVYLYDIDDMQAVVEANIKERQREALLAEEIIHKEVEKFCKWQCSLEVVPTIVALREQIESIRRQELERFMPRLKDMSPQERNAVEALTEGIINKILHKPVTTLKKHAHTNDIQSYLEATHNLFGLDNAINQKEDRKTDESLELRESGQQVSPLSSQPGSPEAAKI